MFDPAALRADFPALQQKVNGHPLVYLDNGATTQKPRPVLDVLTHYYEKDNANVHRGLHELSNRATTAYENARARVARYLHAASPEEIVFTRGTTEAVNLVAHGLAARLRPGDEILLTEMEHHSNLVPWQMAAERSGATLRYVPVTEHGSALDLSGLDSLLSCKTRIFAFTHISNTLGVINPVKELCQRARAAGALTFVDAAQSAGHEKIDVQNLGCDFLAFSGHKCAGPTGIGVLYGRFEALDSLPPYQGGGEMISTVRYEGSTYKAAPQKFEAGTPNIADAIGLAAALDYLDGVGLADIFAHDRALAAYAHEQMAALGFLRILGPGPQDRSGLVTFTMDGVHAADVVTTANQFGIALRGGHHCTEPLHHKLGIPASARASFYLYNTREEVDVLVATLRRIHGIFS
ncbi:MAG: SufS family cysteine desulfurase [Candidatus Methylacidiphilales bacterium]|nr:SufS family cysteine desulfurase [Candidatus Methylacidiphilales bacterium]